MLKLFLTEFSWAIENVGAHSHYSMMSPFTLRSIFYPHFNMVLGEVVLWLLRMEISSIFGLQTYVTNTSNGIKLDGTSHSSLLLFSQSSAKSFHPQTRGYHDVISAMQSEQKPFDTDSDPFGTW